MKRFTRSALLCAFASSLAVAPACADDVFLTYNTDIHAAAGTTVQITGTVSAPSTNGYTISIYGADSGIQDPLVVDDSALFLSRPTLAPGTSYEGPLFSVIVPVGVKDGLYYGYFDFEYAGLDGSGGYASSEFQVTTAAVAATPEPGTWLLLSTGLAGAGLLRRRTA